MRKRGLFFWLVVAMAGATLLTVAMGVSLYFFAQSFRPPVKSIGEGSVLRLDLSQSYPEETLYDLSGPFFHQTQLTFRDLLQSVDRAKSDDDIDSLFIYVRPGAMGWANAVALRRAIVDFQESGKPAAAYLEWASTRDYYLASAAQTVYMHPRGLLDLRGIRAEVLFVRDLFDKIGVEAEFVRAGAYKDAPDMFLRNDLSERSRESLGALIQTFHDELVTAIRMGRELSQDSAERAIQDGPFTPTQAKAAGLVDHLVSVDEARRHLEHRPDGSEPDSDPGTSVAGETPVEVEDQDEAAETNAITNDDEPGELVSVADYHRARRRALGARGLGTSGRVALVYAVGAIVSGGSGEDAMFGRVMGSDTLTEALRTVRKDRSVDAVVLRIDSPGGTSVASDLIWREAMLTGQEKPVVVSMGNVAASGGYWLATASDVVVAEPTTVTGSIGVFAGKFNVAGLYEKLGLSTDGVSTADNADFFSGSRSFSESERERMQSWVLEDYEAFLHRVAEARGISRDEAHAVAQGRVWSGRDALEVGLVDELGGLDRAIAVAKEKAGLDEDDLVELVVYPKKRNFYEVLLSELSPASTRRSVGPPSELAWLQWIESSETLRALRGARTLTLMPFDLRIK